MSGFLASFQDQIAALEATCLDVLIRIPLQAWSFGGGTALALFYLQHRRSHDIGIFVNDPQYFVFLSPKWFIDHQTVFQSEYVEQANHISLATLTGVRVDILLAPRLTDKPSILTRVGQVDCYVESLEEILAKKIHCRLAQPRTRDIVDMGIALTHSPGILRELVNQNAVTLDEHFEWREALGGIHRERYLEELEILEPAARYRDSSIHGIEAIIAGIDSLKS